MSRFRRRHAPRRLSLELLEDRRLPAVLTVNTTADDTTADSTLSLREAIELVDGSLALSALSTQEQAQVSGSLSSTPDTIDFNIPGSGVQTIAPTSALPAITAPVTIDGYSQPGASAGGHLLATFGATNLTDLPAPADYDGVGHTEPAVYRSSTGQWFVLGPSGGKLLGTFGQPRDIPVPGAYDPANKIELAVYRPSTTEWLVLEPSGVVSEASSGPGQIPVIGPDGSLLVWISGAQAQTPTALASLSVAPSVAGLAAQPNSQGTSLLIPLVPARETASPLQPIVPTAGRKTSS